MECRYVIKDFANGLLPTPTSISTALSNHVTTDLANQISDLLRFFGGDLASNVRFRNLLIES